MINVIIGKKVNMSNRFDAQGKRIPVTVVSANANVVAKIKSGDKDGYDAIQIGLGNEKKPIKSQLGNYKYLPSVPKILREFRVDNLEGIQKGNTIDASNFKVGDLVKVTGVSKGRGFAGAMKRHGFHGGPKTHGQSDRHRAPGSLGQGTTPGRVFKGKKMAGHMGDERVTIPQLVVVETDKENNLLVIQGSLPGSRNGVLLIEKVGKVEGYGQKVASESEEPDESNVKETATVAEDTATMEGVEGNQKVDEVIKDEPKEDDNPSTTLEVKEKEDAKASK